MHLQRQSDEQIEVASKRTLAEEELAIFDAHLAGKWSDLNSMDSMNEITSNSVTQNTADCVSKR